MSACPSYLPTLGCYPELSQAQVSLQRYVLVCADQSALQQVPDLVRQPLGPVAWPEGVSTDTAREVENTALKRQIPKKSSSPLCFVKSSHELRFCASTCLQVCTVYGKTGVFTHWELIMKISWNIAPAAGHTE